MIVVLDRRPDVAASERGHMLEGLAVALANIDEFIRIIRESPTPPVAKTELMARSWDSSLVREMLTRAREDGSRVNADDYRPEGLEREYGMQADGLYRLSETQAQEILQMRLQRLTGLEQDKIVAEYKEVMAEIDDLLSAKITWVSSNRRPVSWGIRVRGYWKHRLSRSRRLISGDGRKTVYRVRT